MHTCTHTHARTHTNVHTHTHTHTHIHTYIQTDRQTDRHDTCTALQYFLSHTHLFPSENCIPVKGREQRLHPLLLRWTRLVACSVGICSLLFHAGECCSGCHSYHVSDVWWVQPWSVVRDYCGHAHFDIGPTWGESQNLIDFADLVKRFDSSMQYHDCLIYTDTGLTTYNHCVLFDCQIWFWQMKAILIVDILWPLSAQQ